MLLLILAVAFSSCRKLIRDEFPYMEPKPVVNAIIRDGVPISVHVSLSGQLDTMPLNAVENAVVNLFVDGVFAEQLTHRSPDSARYYDYDNLENGHYTSTLFAQQGKHYSLEVSVPGVSNVRCETYLPHSERILNIQFIENAGKYSDGYTVPALRVTFTNNPAERRYYELSIKTCDVSTGYWTDSGYIRIYTADTVLTPDGAEIELVNISDPVILGEGFPIPVFSNRMIKDSVYTMYVEFTNGYYGGGSSTDNVMVMDYDAVLVELRSIDPAYYHYKRSYHLYSKNMELSDIGAIFAPHPLYSNVDGGYGLFSAYSKKETYTFFPKYYR